MAILDIDEAAGKSLVESLEKQFGKEKTLFIRCNVQLDEQVKGEQTVQMQSGSE